MSILTHIIGWPFLAALLTFRVLYFLLPLCLAALSLGVRELRILAAAEETRSTRHAPDA